MYSKLEIKLLSQSGHVLKSIRCVAGQISVLRAHSPSELKPYQRVLAGVPGAEKFSLTLDGDEYNAYQHILIGFGENFFKGSESVKKYLTNFGVSEDSIPSLLLSNGLEHIIDGECSALPPAEARMLRLLAATFSSDKVLVLNDPFEPLGSQWRERYAELILQYTKELDAIVVVAALTSRPECWIDNPRIERIQLSDVRQRTIGVAASQDDIKNAIAQIRADSVSGAFDLNKLQTQLNIKTEGVDPHIEKLASEENLPPQPSQEELEDAKQLKIFGIALTFGKKKRDYVYLGALALILLPISLTLLFKERDQTKLTLIEEHSEQHSDSNLSISKTDDVNQATDSLTNPKNLHQVTPSATPHSELIPPTINQPETMPTFQTVLDLYPIDVKNSVIRSYQGESNFATTESNNSSQAHYAATSKAASTKSALLGMLEQTSEKPSQAAEQGESGGFAPEYQDNSVNNYEQQVPLSPENPDMSWEERREMMRRRFLESIGAASQ